MSNTVKPRNNGCQKTTKFYEFLNVDVWRIFDNANIGCKKEWVEGIKVKQLVKVDFRYSRVW